MVSVPTFPFFMITSVFICEQGEKYVLFLLIRATALNLHSLLYIHNISGSEYTIKQREESKIGEIKTTGKNVALSRVTR